MKQWAVAALTVALGASTGCLDRPVKEVDPLTSNVFVIQDTQRKIDKIDLLFVIDNSTSMADKQAILKLAVPNLLSRLVDPICEGPGGMRVEPEGDRCPAGTRREFEPIDDIHVGVITSSLGSHGAGNTPSCDDVPPGNDRGRLLPTVRPDAGLIAEPAGFLAWTATSTPEEFLPAFQQQVVAAGEEGCGLEATLEAWYRFLIDPTPPLTVGRNDKIAVPEGIDEELLAQRSAFLRPDSLLAIVMVTDENDCSIRDSDNGVLAADMNWSMAEATAACASDPNDRCCLSCSSLEYLPEGCSADPCVSPGNPKLAANFDRLNMRCFEQKRRFGLDLLYPTSRYVDGLTQRQIPDRSGNLVPNPIYAETPGGAARDPSLVVLAGIVGVPWQLIATDDSLSGRNLTYLTAREITKRDIWPALVGTDGAEPTDPHMIESIDSRPELPRWDDAPLGDPIHGHEFDGNYLTARYDDGLPARDDLQYACTFPLPEERPCADSDPACDCSSADAVKHSSLCRGTTQTHAKGYPGTRHLEVLRDFGDNSIVASICPKNPASDDPGDLQAGYQPAVGAIVERLGEVLADQCLPRELHVVDGVVPCSVVETSRHAIDCGVPGRKVVDAKVAPSIRKKLEEASFCGGETGVSCDQYSMCEIEQLAGEALGECLTSEFPTTAGYCYVDPVQQRAEGIEVLESLVDRCEPTRRRVLRFVSTNEVTTPVTGSTVFIACVGRSYTDSSRRSEDMASGTP